MLFSKQKEANHGDLISKHTAAFATKNDHCWIQIKKSDEQQPERYHAELHVVPSDGKEVDLDLNSWK